MGVEQLVEFAQGIAPILSAGAGMLAGLVAVYTVSKTLEFSRSVRDLQKHLGKAELQFKADLSDTTDRELRKILTHIHHEKESKFSNWVLKSEDLKKYSDSDLDYIVFVDAFGKLENREKMAICNRIKTRDFVDQAEVIKKLLVRSHLLAQEKLESSDQSLFVWSKSKAEAKKDRETSILN